MTTNLIDRPKHRALSAASIGAMAIGATARRCAGDRCARRRAARRPPPRRPTRTFRDAHNRPPDRRPSHDPGIGQSARLEHFQLVLSTGPWDGSLDSYEDCIRGRLGNGVATTLAPEARAARRARRRAGKSPPAARLTRPAPARVGRCPVSRLVIDRVGRSPSAYSWPARHRGLRATISVSTHVPRVGGCCRATQASSTSVSATASGGERPFRSRRDPVSRVTRSHQDRSVGVPSGVGDEYAISERPTPPRNSRLTGDRTTPTDAGIVRSWPTGRSCHAANGRAERNSRSRPAGDRPSARAHRSR